MKKESNNWLGSWAYHEEACIIKQKLEDTLSKIKFSKSNACLRIGELHFKTEPHSWSDGAEQINGTCINAVFTGRWSKKDIEINLARIDGFVSAFRLAIELNKAGVLN